MSPIREICSLPEDKSSICQFIGITDRVDNKPLQRRLPNISDKEANSREFNRNGRVRQYQKCSCQNNTHVVPNSRF